MQRNIVIVDALSTAISFIPDIIKRNYRPVVLETNMGENAEPSLLAARATVRRRYADKADFIEEKESYEETLAEIRSLNPLFVIQGCESGVELATRLADDLGLRGNPYSGLDKLVHKDAMHEALKDYGIRYIRGKIVSSLDEAIAYYREQNFRHGCVVKPSRGAGTVGVHLCDNEEEMVAALREEFGNTNIFGNDSSILLQERIVGAEYIVNTISVDGKHRLSSVWKYTKKRVRGGGNVYDYDGVLDTLGAGHCRMIRYAMDVADAIGFQNGYIHGEYMIDEDGPILIEVNCRPMGGNLTDTYLDPVMGHHETDNLLDSYLDPAWHEAMMKVPYRPYSKCYVKYFITPENTSVNLAPVISIIKHLRSYKQASISAALSGRLTRTVDLETAGGLVYLAHEDSRILEHDLQFLRRVEQEYYHMLFSTKAFDPASRPATLTSVQEVMEQCGCNRSTLILTNDDTLDVNAMIIHSEDKREPDGLYNWAVLDFDYRDNEDTERLTDEFYYLASKVQKGGHIVIPEKTYWHFPYGAESIEILCESIGLILEAPGPFDGNAVIATVHD